jgi:hypothetical protein
LKRVMVTLYEMGLVRSYPFFIANGKLYQLIENEETDLWELNVEEIK